MAAGITDSTIEEIKARIDLADLIASYGVQVRTAGASKKACCPFHNEKTPSFNINESRGFYHCFGCGESGDAIKFVQKMEGLTFVEAVKKLAGQCGVKIEEREDPAAGKRKRLYALMAELAQFYHRCLLKTKEAQLARDYLKSRDLGGEVQESFLIGYAPTGMKTILQWAGKYGYTADELAEAGVVKPPDGPGDSGFHRFGGRLMFSIRDRQGRVVAFSGRQLVENRRSGKYVNSPETPIFKKSNVLFGFDKAAANIAKAPHREAIVCEGQIDTIRLHVSGFPVAVASQGTAFTEEHVKMLKKVADQVALVFDDDGAGHKATIRTAGLFLAAEMPVRVVSLPGGDDPDSFLRTHGGEAFQALLDRAESIMSAQIRMERAKEANPKSVEAVNRITKAVLATIAQSTNAVLKAGMAGEAAELLGLPVAALQEELAKIRPSAMAGARASSGDDAAAAETAPCEDADGPLEGEDARAAEPPPACERSLMEFLLANEYDAELGGMMAEFLPDRVIRNELTRRFLATWREEAACGEDRFAEFRAGLDARACAWFDASVVGAGKTQASDRTPADILQEHIRSIWAVHLRARRNALPADADAETAQLSYRLQMNGRQIASRKWSLAADIIRDYIREENHG